MRTLVLTTIFTLCLPTLAFIQRDEPAFDKNSLLEILQKNPMAIGSE